VKREGACERRRDRGEIQRVREDKKREEQHRRWIRGIE